jgi:hypothetical protein
MRPKLFLPLVTILIITMLFAPHRVHACSCAISPFWQSFATSDVVFLGTLAAIEYPPSAETFSSANPITYTLQVHYVWKGVEGTTIEVSTARDSASCGADLQEGKTYMLYGYRNPTIPSNLSTSLCSYTHPTTTFRPYWYDLDHLRQRIGVVLGLRERVEFPY